MGYIGMGVEIVRPDYQVGGEYPNAQHEAYLGLRHLDYTVEGRIDIPEAYIDATNVLFHYALCNDGRVAGVVYDAPDGADFYYIVPSCTKYIVGIREDGKKNVYEVNNGYANYVGSGKAWFYYKFEDGTVVVVAGSLQALLGIATYAGRIANAIRGAILTFGLWKLIDIAENYSEARRTEAEIKRSAITILQDTINTNPNLVPQIIPVVESVAESYRPDAGKDIWHTIIDFVKSFGPIFGGLLLLLLLIDLIKSIRGR